MRVYSVNCEHVFDLKPGGLELWKFKVQNPVDGFVSDFHKEWKFCPICGKEALFTNEIKK